jgi:tripartite motif-containing protein 71
MNIKRIIRHILYFIIILLTTVGCNKELADSHNTRSVTPRFITPYIFITQWGSKGEENGQFNKLVSIAVNSAGEVYVLDYKVKITMDNGLDCIESYRIQKFDSKGTFIKKWKNKGNNINAEGQYDVPEHISTDPDNYVYITNSGNGCIEKFDSNGKFMSNWGGFIEVDKYVKIGIPYGIGIDSNYNVYVTNYHDNSSMTGGLPWIIKYDSKEKFIKKWQEEGYGNCFLGNIAIDKSGYIYTTVSFFDIHDTELSSEIYKLDQSGKIITRWNLTTAGGVELDIAVNHQGNILVSNGKSNEIELFDSNGDFIINVGSGGNGDGQFNSPRGIAVDFEGNLYVADTGNYRIQKFKANPEFKAK